MPNSEKPLRIVVWSTGGVGVNAIDAIRRRPDLELVGVWVLPPRRWVGMRGSWQVSSRWV